MSRTGVLLFCVVLTGAAGGVAEEPCSAPAPWVLPAEGVCRPGGEFVAGGLAGDVPLPSLRPRDVIEADRVETLRPYLPAEVWEFREHFFFEGMRLEIGPCFRDYGPPAFFAAATERFAGAAVLAENGGLTQSTAGLPFSPESLSVDDPRAGLKWAWNIVHRYQGAGFRGKFRIVDIFGPSGRAEPFEGEIFKLQLGHRSDRAADGYRVPETGRRLWAAGGRYQLPFDLREFAWLQYREEESQVEPQRSDDLHLYVPAARKVRRVPAGHLEGLFTPSATVGVRYRDGSATREREPALPREIEPKRSGFEGLELRPLLYTYRVRGLQDVLAPINAARPAYPEEAERSFGPGGLSWASDRWDLRRALVLEATRNGPDVGSAFASFRLWVDLQTLYPLFYVSRAPGGEVVDIGYFVGRWSEDRPDYPRWPDDPARPVRVIDPAGAAFANLTLRAGWRRESWSVVSTPEDDRKLRRAISLRRLESGR